MAEFVKFGFIGGVLAPGYRNRTDLNKFDLALEAGTNWFVDYQGGLATRPGTKFLDFIMKDTENVVLTPFQYGYDVSNTYEIMFGANYIRFVQDGAYVLEAFQNVTDVPGIRIRIDGHGFTTGDWVKLTAFGKPEFDGRTGVVTVININLFELADPYGVPIVITSWVSGGQVARIYTIVSTFSSNRIPSLNFHQIKDTLRISSRRRLFLPYSLKRTTSTNWALTQLNLANAIAIPVNLVGSSGGGGTSSVMYSVTAVSREGEESLASARVTISSMKDFTVEAGWAAITWDKQNNVLYYNVYRSIVSANGQLTQAAEMGYVGRAYGPQFTDNNIIPDFVKTPPLANNPFANKSILAINVVASGAGYTSASVITVTDATGVSFRGFPVVFGGQVLAVVVENGGQNYTAPVVTATVGAGATFSVELTEADGNYPSVGIRFQQKQIWASTKNNPLTIYGSKPGLYDNFDFSRIVVSNDSFEYDIDSEVITAVKHLVATRAGLLVLTESGMWQIVGTNDGPVTAIDAMAQQQSYNGVADVPPLQVNEDLIIVDSENSAARMMAYSDFQRSYSSIDISILSNHYFSQFNLITSWSYLSSPHRLILATREDGTMLAGCVVKEHEVFGWTDWSTQGSFKQVSRLRERVVDTAYLIVERVVGDVIRKYLEKFAPRKFKLVEDVICLDSALTLSATKPNSTLLPAALSGTVRIRADVGTFVAGDVGKIFRGGGGMGEVTAYINSHSLEVSLTRDITWLLPNTTRPGTIANGDWTLDTPTLTLYGLEHLEGKTVNALLDGNVYTNLVVDQYRLSLPIACTRAVVGLSYDCVGKALVINSPQVTIENKRKRVVGVALWQNESRGIKVGTRPDKLYEVKERRSEPSALPQELQSSLTDTSLDPVWEQDATLYFKQTDPLPSSLLGWILRTEISDDDD